MLVRRQKGRMIRRSRAWKKAFWSGYMIGCQETFNAIYPMDKVPWEFKKLKEQHGIVV